MAPYGSPDFMKWYGERLRNSRMHPGGPQDHSAGVNIPGMNTGPAAPGPALTSTAPQPPVGAPPEAVPENFFDTGGGGAPLAGGNTLPSGPAGPPPMPPDMQAIGPGPGDFTPYNGGAGLESRLPEEMGMPGAPPMPGEEPGFGDKAKGFGNSILDFLGGIGRFIAHPVATLENMQVDQAMADRINQGRMNEVLRQRNLGFDVPDPSTLSIDDIKMANYGKGHIWEDTRVPQPSGLEEDLLSDRLAHERRKDYDEHSLGMDRKRIENAFEVAGDLNQQMPRYDVPEATLDDSVDFWSNEQFSIPEADTGISSIIPDFQVKEHLFGSGPMAEDIISRAVASAERIPQARLLERTEIQSEAQRLLYELEAVARRNGHEADKGAIARQFQVEFPAALKRLAQEKEREGLGNPMSFLGKIGSFNVQGTTVAPTESTDPQYYPQR